MRGAGGVVANQRAQHAGGVGIAAGTGIVLGVGNDDRLARGLCQFHRVTDAVVRRIDAAVEIVLMAFDQGDQFVGCSICIGLGLAIGEHARSAIPEIGGRKSRRKGQRRHGVALQHRQLLIDSFGRLVVGALPADRDQERQLPESLCKARLGLQHQREMFCASLTRVGHIDVRIGAVRNECIRVLDHVRRHIGVQVEADHQRQFLADHLAHARQDFAFAVVEMLGHHGAVQVEIDGVKRAGGCDAFDHFLDDALERVLGDMGRGTGAAGDRRDHFPAIGFGRLDKSCKADIDPAHHLEDVGAIRHRRPAAAMHEIVVGRLRRCEGIGLVQETANRDAGHQ